MALITKYGSFWGLIPVTSGRYFWVAPTSQYTVEGQVYPASDNNDGLSPERALRTVNAAIALATASVNDVVVLLPGNHSVATTILVNKAGLTIVGIPGDFPLSQARHGSGGKRLKTQIASTEAIAATTGRIMTISAPDTEVAFIHFTVSAGGGQGIALTPTVSVANRPYVHDCTFALQGTASVTTYGIAVNAGVSADVLDDPLIANCYFVSGLDTTSGANGPAIQVIGTTHGMTIESCTFELKGIAAWAVALGINPISVGATLGILIRDNDFVNPTSATTVITTAISSTTATTAGAIVAYRNFIDAGTDAATATAINVITMAENYLAGAGGTLANNN